MAACSSAISAYICDIYIVIYIKVPAEEIWAALTRPEYISQCYFGRLVEADLQPGGTFVYHAPDRLAVLVEVSVIEAEPPRRLIVTRHPRRLHDAGEPPTRVSIVIELDLAGYCGLTLPHARLQSAPEAAARRNRNWMLALSGLKTLLEIGTPLACP
jgi:uncharacterized protein YndB with AHSA1/START domain